MSTMVLVTMLYITTLLTLCLLSHLVTAFLTTGAHSEAGSPAQPAEALAEESSDASGAIRSFLEGGHAQGWKDHGRFEREELKIHL